MSRIINIYLATVVAATVSSSVNSEGAAFDLSGFGISLDKGYSIGDFQGAFGKIQKSALPKAEMSWAESTLISRIVEDYPEYTTVFDSAKGTAKLYFRPKNLFAHNNFEASIATGDIQVQWESGPIQFKSIETDARNGLDLILRAQDTTNSFQAEIIGSALWSQQGFLTDVDPGSLPSSIQQKLELIAPPSQVGIGLVGIPNADFFASYSRNSALDYPWSADPSISNFNRPSGLNGIDITLGETTITAEDFVVSKTSGGGITISGDTDDGLGRLQLASDPSGQFGGMLIHDDQQWIVTPLSEQVGGSLYSFVPIGTAAVGPELFSERFDDEEPEVPQGNFGADEQDFRSELIALAPKEVVTVSFVYSSEAETYLGKTGVPALIDRFGFSELARVNGLGGSGTVDFRSVGHTSSNFDDGRNYGQILTELTTGASSEAIAIRSFRDSEAADIVVLAVFRSGPDYEWYCGRVAEIAAQSEKAFLVWNISPKCMFRNSLAHELGHIFGGVHENHSKEPIRPYAYAFSIESDGGQCSTAMSNKACTRCSRSGWSSPISQFYHPKQCQGQVMGTRDKNDVARLLAEFAPIVSKFRN